MKKRIMVADDDSAIVDVLQIVLEDAGFAVETYAQGQSVKNMQEPFPDLVLLDILLAGMDGRVICRHLKNQTATQRIPIILLSAHTDAQQTATDAGADAFLPKPFDIDELLDLVEKYLS
ncbi:response regulator [Dictyobacter formicarum]|uniref:Response regulatory domain-containing protein n=1 Tax=Dictyobacter formicarum TaxID=2778368 RepID=A0ABQ3VS08_9CHLR|nr:response regulator transcription factor [Dictyobacter formicarum]GHO88506.1 hypothetical protein KSZ_65120 [Dictyobacter formicarum]